MMYPIRSTYIIVPESWLKILRTVKNNLTETSADLPPFKHEYGAYLYGVRFQILRNTTIQTRMDHDVGDTTQWPISAVHITFFMEFSGSTMSS